jgi:hypothetical protein
VSGAAIALAALNALGALLGGWCWSRGHVSDRRAVRAFWILLRAGQGAAVLYALAAGALAATGARPDEQLFYLYALLPLAVAFIAEQLRVASAQTILDQRGLENAAAVGRLPEPEQHALVAAIVHRELGIMALSALVVAFLALRAAATAHGF